MDRGVVKKNNNQPNANQLTNIRITGRWERNSDTNEVELPICHLMESEKFSLVHGTSGLVSAYRQIEIDHFHQFSSALRAWEDANHEASSRFYLLNQAGQEYYDGSWIE